MASLNAFLPVLSDLVGVSPGVLYERQRSMVQLGLIASKPGRGPGSGVSLSPENVAKLLISYAGADSLADVARSKKVFAAAGYNPDFACPITGQKTFLKILTQILAHPDLSARVPRIEIDLNGPMILMSYWPARRSKAHYYELYIDEDSSPFKGVVKRSIIGQLDRISAALHPLVNNMSKGE
jgi:hypothetical protein